MKKMLAIALCVILLGSGFVYAGTTYTSYDTTVGKFNGNGYTGYQTKTWAGANGALDSYTVGGNYTVDARMIDTDGNKGPWTRDVDDNTWHELGGDSGQKSGSSVRVQFSNDWTTPVAVQVTGRWKSN